MLKSLSQLFDRAFGDAADPETDESRRHGVEIATALLLIEVERADFTEDPVEQEKSFALLKRHFHLSDDEAQMLLDDAREEADRAASLQAFTRRLHATLTPAEKHRVVEMLWRVALADGKLDKHEDHLIRKIADLLYVSHGDVIRIRNRVRDDAGV